MFSKHVTLSIPQVLAFLVVVSNQLVCLVFQRPHKATADEMTKYHSDDYIKFLRSIRPDNMSEFSKQMQRCKSLCPLWDITEFCVLFQVRNTRSSSALLFPVILLKQNFEHLPVFWFPIYLCIYLLCSQCWGGLSSIRWLV